MTILQPPVIPAGMTVALAMSLGLLPADIQVTGFGAGAQNPTLAQLMSAGLVLGSSLASSLSFTSPATYGGS